MEFTDINIYTNYPDVAFTEIDFVNGGKKTYFISPNIYPLPSAFGTSTPPFQVKQVFDSNKKLTATFKFECYSCINSTHAYYPVIVVFPPVWVK
jgi:hypothetical protein